jgi:hypothetical protein
VLRLSHLPTFPLLFLGRPITIRRRIPQQLLHITWLLWPLTLLSSDVDQPNPLATNGVTADLKPPPNRHGYGGLLELPIGNRADCVLRYANSLCCLVPVPAYSFPHIT